MTDDLLKRAEPFLNVCGSCDLGMPTTCTCPTGDPRPVMLDLVREVERLRREHEARRGSDVEAWIKRARDEWRGAGGSTAYLGLDELLDSYHEHADCGVPLDEASAGPHPEED